MPRGSAISTLRNNPVYSIVSFGLSFQFLACYNAPPDLSDEDVIPSAPAAETGDDGSFPSIEDEKSSEDEDSRGSANTPADSMPGSSSDDGNKENLPGGSGDDPGDEKETSDEDPSTSDDTTGDDDSPEPDNSESETDGGENSDEEESESFGDDNDDSQDPIECEDPTDDCPTPDSKCQEAYCDKSDLCAERPVPDGTEISSWSPWGNCTYENECSEEGTRGRRREICKDGKIEVEEESDQIECDRQTDGIVVEEGSYGECIAESDGRNGCREVKTRSNQKVCEDGSTETAAPDTKVCTGEADGKDRCNVCGNGVVETREGEACENGDDFCGECKWVVYVNVSASGSNSGASWTNAFTDLQDGIDKAKELIANKQDTQVWVARGTYIPQGDRNSSFHFDADVPVFGGFRSGDEEFSDRSSDPSKTILDGDLSGNDSSDFGNRGDNSYHVVTVSDGADAQLDGFTIRGGHSNNSGTTRQGGGIYIVSGDLSLENVTVKDNYAGFTGGGIFITGTSELNIKGNVEIENNRVREYGGGFFLDGKNVRMVVTGSLDITGNEAQEDLGGGFRVNGAQFIASNGAKVLVDDNHALERSGGGFITHGGSVVVKGSGTKMTISNNSSEWGGGGFRSTAWKDGSPGVVSAEDNGEIYFDSNTSNKGSGGAFFSETGCTVKQSGGGLIHGRNNSAPNSESGINGYYTTEKMTSVFDIGNKPNYNGGDVIN